jgi:hypothetical protein
MHAQPRTNSSVEGTYVGNTETCIHFAHETCGTRRSWYCTWYAERQNLLTRPVRNLHPHAYMPEIKKNERDGDSGQRRSMKLKLRYMVRILLNSHQAAMGSTGIQARATYVSASTRLYISYADPGLDQARAKCSAATAPPPRHRHLTPSNDPSSLPH